MLKSFLFAFNSSRVDFELKTKVILEIISYLIVINVTNSNLQ